MRVTPGPVSGGHSALIERASFSPDGERFVAGDGNGGLIVRTRDGEITAKVRVPRAGATSSAQVRAVAWSPDGSRIAVEEYGSVRLRRPADLAEEAEAKRIGGGPLAFGGGGRWLALLSGDSLSVRGVPAFDDFGLHLLRRGSYEYFSADMLAVDPHGFLIAVADDGGCDETAMGARTAQGEPQVTLIDAERRVQLRAIERGHPIFALEFDPWRGRLLTVLHRDVGAWSRKGEAIARFAPYPGSYARSLAVSEQWIATAPSTGERARIDFFDPDTYARLATVDLPGPVAPRWIAASADGGTFVTPELPHNRDFAVRIWTVEGYQRPRQGPGRIHVMAAKLSSPEQLPDIEGPRLVFTWDQDESDSIVTDGHTVVWRERTGWEVYERFGEIAAILQRKYGARLKDLVPTPGSEWALYGDTSRASPYVRSIRAQLASGELLHVDATQKRDAES